MNENELNHHHDTCSKCVCRGYLTMCVQSICCTHHSWYVGELRKRIDEQGAKLRDIADALKINHALLGIEE